MGTKVVEVKVNMRSEDFSASSQVEKINLSKENLKKIALPEKGSRRVWDNELNGLFISLSSKGNAVAYFRYRINLLQRDYRIGRLDRLSMKAIRDEARKVSAKVELGRDPQLERNEEKSQQREARRKDRPNKLTTLGNFYHHYYQDYAKANLKDYRSRLGVLEFNFKQWFDWPMEDLTVSVVSQWRNQKMNTPVVLGKGENRTEHKRSPGGVNRPLRICAHYCLWPMKR